MLICSLTVFLMSLSLSLITSVLIRRVKYFKKNDISLLGGLAIWSSFLIVTLLLFVFIKQVILSKEILGIYFCSTLIFAMGLLDDKKDLSVPIKFSLQLIASIIVVAFGVKTDILGIGQLGNLAITLLWILGITNAFNHLDIIDGLASGVAFISAFTFFTISIITLNVTIALIFLTLTGSILGFFRFNFPKASIYMGNSGSHFLGFILSTLAIMISYATLQTRVALIMPLLVLGLPIFDTIFVIWIRLLKKKPIWKKSDDHLPLRLIISGKSKKQAVLRMFLITFIFCSNAILILFLSNKSAIGLLTLLFILCLLIALKARKIKVDG